MIKFKAIPTAPIIDFTDYERDLPLQLKNYADSITKEAEDGWDFVAVYPFQARYVESGGTLWKMIKNKVAGRDFFDSVKQSFTTNMILFKKVDLEKPYSSNDSSKQCPYCANLVLQKAIVCQYCHKDLQKYNEEQKEKEDELNRQNEEKIKELIKDSKLNIGDTYRIINQTEVKPKQDIYLRSTDILSINDNIILLEIGNKINENSIYFWLLIKNPRNEREGWITSENINLNNKDISDLEKMFEDAIDENEKVEIAKKLYSLGKMYYYRFIPK